MALSSIEECKEFLRTRGELRFNVLTQVVEIKPNEPDATWRKFDGPEFNNPFLSETKALKLNAERAGFNLPLYLWEYLVKDNATEYNPILSYFNSLERGFESDVKDWPTSQIDILLGMLNMPTSAIDVYRPLFSKWMGMAAASMAGIACNNVTLAIIAPQQLASAVQWLNNLYPDRLRLSKTAHDDKIQLDRRSWKSKQILRECGWINLRDQLAKAKTDTAAWNFKGLLEMKDLYYNRSKHTETFQRIANFVAVFNHVDVVAIQEYKHKFICLPAGEIRLSNIDVDLLWAEAWAFARNPENRDRLFWTTEDLKQIFKLNAHPMPPPLITATPTSARRRGRACRGGG